jgi:hypothetical protein
MRGEIFNEFLEFAAESLGPERAAAVKACPGGAAAYDAAGRYDFAELVRLADRVAEARGESRADVLTRFGAHLFRYFAALYPSFLDEAPSAIALLAHIDTYVHRELQKLYPEAEFPGFECVAIASGGLQMTYRSTKPLADLAEGLIRGSVDHFGDPVRIAREDLPGPAGTAARFVLLPHA